MESRLGCFLHTSPSTSSAEDGDDEDDEEEEEGVIELNWNSSKKKMFRHALQDMRLQLLI